MMRKKVILIGLMAVVILFSSWGFLVHRTINQIAIYELPKKMQAFFYTNKDYLVYNAPRPDVRRNSDTTEGSKHFIDFEYFGDSSQYKMPRVYEDAVAQFGEKKMKDWGTLPYVIIETQAKLTNAFRNKNRDSILYYAADLGHYIGDAHVPLHTSSNYDGQLTNQRGMHDLWETTVPELELQNYQISSGHSATYLKSPTDAIWKALQHTHSLLPEMLAVEKEISKNYTDSTKYRWQVRWGKNRRFYSSAFGREYGKRLEKSINGQLINAANLLADFWYTAWVDAGKPNLKPLVTKMYKKEYFKAERKAFLKNKLMEQKMLISKQRPSND